MKPTIEFKEGTVKAAIFERSVRGENGDFTSHSIAVQKGYQKNGEWKNQSMTVFRQDLPRLVKVLTDAAKHLGVQLLDA